VVLVGPLWIPVVRGVWSFCYLVKELRGRFFGERIRKKGWRTEIGVKDGDDMMQLAGSPSQASIEEAHTTPFVLYCTVLLHHVTNGKMKGNQDYSFLMLTSEARELARKRLAKVGAIDG
jgi:hypothetical protein